MSKAKTCFSLININPLDDFDAFPCIAFAQYYETTGKEDSAAIYCQCVLDDGTSIYNMYDASKMLYRIYSRKNDVHKAKLYADIYIQLGDSLDLGKRQELAATVNNQYKYQWNQKKEQKLKEEKERYRNMFIMVLLAAMLLTSVGYILYIRKRNRHLRQMLAMSSELQKLTDNEKQLNKTIEQRERQLEERKEQNRRLVNLLHQAELEEKAEDVIESIRQAAVGKKNMSNADWKRLYKAVDELYPELRENLMAQGSLTEQQVQVCYLMRIGLPAAQIQNITELSRTTVWRWMKRFSFAHGSKNKLLNSR